MCSASIFFFLHRCQLKLALQGGEGRKGKTKKLARRRARMAEEFNWRAQPNVVGSDVASFLESRCGARGRECNCNYTLFTGGKYSVPDLLLPELYQLLARALRAGVMPAINEIRSVHFPFYVDFDFELPFSDLDASVYRKLADVANRQVMRFFPEGTAPFRCIVCTKSKGASPGKAAGTWKHGVHMHWPFLIVLLEQALQLRAAFVVAYDAMSWSDDLGIERPPWESILDAQVYRAACGGLRMLGAPKAKKCTACIGQRSCTVCGKQNNACILDLNVYQLFGVFAGGVADDAELQRLRSNAQHLLCSTSVRRDATKTALTEGYRPFVGCPNVCSEWLEGSSRKRRDRGTLLRDDTKRFGARFKKDVTNPKVVEIVRALLVQHNERYATCRVTIKADDRSMRVALSGEGARYCENKGDYHKQQNVYMEIYKGGGNVEYFSRMRCFCACPVVRKGGTTCKEFKSWRPIAITPEDASALFVVRDVSSTDCPLATTRMLAAQIREQEREIKESRRLRQEAQTAPTD